MAKKTSTIPSYSYEDTTDENVKKFVDLDGNWTHYFLVKEKRFVKSVTHILHLGYAKGPRFHEWLLSVSKEEAKKKLETAGDEGSRTHYAIRDLIRGMKITDSTKYPSELHNGRQDVLNNEEWKNLQAFMAFAERYNPRTIANEFTVYRSTGSGYAGTVDYLCILTVPSGDKVFDKKFWGQDVMALLDWKTSAAIYDEYLAQTAAYAAAIAQRKMFAEYDAQFAGKGFTGVVRLGTKHKSGFELQVWGDDQAAKNCNLFSAAQTIADETEPTFEPVIEQIPTQFYIKIPKATVPKAKKVAKAITKKSANKKSI